VKLEHESTRNIARTAPSMFNRNIRAFLSSAIVVPPKKNNYKPDEKRKMLALTTYLLVVILARSRYAIGGEDCT
jgi:hypothetical protein